MDNITDMAQNIPIGQVPGYIKTNEPAVQTAYTPQPAQQDLRERAMEIFMDRYVVVGEPEFGESVVDKKEFIEAMLQFAAEVSAGKDEDVYRWINAHNETVNRMLDLRERIAELENELNSCEDIIQSATEYTTKQGERIAELEADVKRLNDTIDNLNIKQE